MKPTLPSTEVIHPSFLYNTHPTIKRPQFDMRKPALRKKRETVIAGGGAHRCMFCSALMPHDDRQCSACGRTQIDPGLLEDQGSLWKKRINAMGVPRRGYNGA